MPRKTPITRIQLRAVEDWLLAHKRDIEAQHIGILEIMHSIEREHGFKPAGNTVRRTAKLFNITIKKRYTTGTRQGFTKYRYAPVLAGIIEQLDELCRTLGHPDRSPLWAAAVPAWLEEYKAGLPDHS